MVHLVNHGLSGALESVTSGMIMGILFLSEIFGLHLTVLACLPKVWRTDIKLQNLMFGKELNFSCHLGLPNHLICKHRLQNPSQTSMQVMLELCFLRWPTPSVDSPVDCEIVFKVLKQILSPVALPTVLRLGEEICFLLHLIALLICGDSFYNTQNHFFFMLNVLVDIWSLFDVVLRFFSPSPSWLLSTEQLLVDLCPLKKIKCVTEFNILECT